MNAGPTGKGGATPPDVQIKRTLLAEARRAFETSYAPYSSFPVGAAVLTPSKQIIRGANIENASYGLSMCAERVAIFTAVASGATRIEALALSIAADVNSAAERMPCGACRQVMAEFMDASAMVYIDQVGDIPLKDLLPNAFILK